VLDLVAAINIYCICIIAFEISQKLSEVENIYMYICMWGAAERKEKVVVAANLITNCTCACDVWSDNRQKEKHACVIRVYVCVHAFVNYICVCICNKRNWVRDRKC
jgi:hypothetical protein